MQEIYPAPFLYEKSSGEFVFSDKVYFIIDKNFSNSGFKKLCCELWKNFTAQKSELELVEKDGIGKTAFISVSKDAAFNKKDTDYEYEIDCTNAGISINYSEDIGLIHAFCTSLQTVGPYRRKTGNFIVEGYTVKDKPLLKMRGMHFCLLKGTSLLMVKKYVMLCAFLKCTHIVLESAGSIKYDTLPYLAWPDSYSKEDLKEIVDYGKSFGIEFIPHFNHVGHASQSRHKTGKHTVLDQAPEYGEWFNACGWTWNVENEEVIEFQRNLRKELCDVFGDGEYFLIGCDEITDLVRIWGENNEEESKGFVNFLNRTLKDIEKNLGRKTLMWGDMFLDKKDFEYPFCANTNDDICYSMDGLDKDMTIIDWQYNINEDKDESIKYFLEHTDSSHLIISPWTGRDHIKGRINLAKKYNCKGVLGTTWNTVYSEINDMVYTACCMWENDTSPYEFDYGYACHLKCMAAQMTRKLCPQSEYEKAGFTESELLGINT